MLQTVEKEGDIFNLLLFFFYFLYQLSFIPVLSDRITATKEAHHKELEFTLCYIIPQGMWRNWELTTVNSLILQELTTVNSFIL